jgi:RNA ligase (TIGR02306 family)
MAEERKLATIETILAIDPIEGADAIERATVRGWQVVVRKGEFKVGDKCVFFEIDSLLPIKPQFDFLSKNGTRKCMVDGTEREGYRLKTIRLKGVVSQGLALPITSFNLSSYEVGSDVTNDIGVVKYEVQLPAQLAGQAKSLFPSFIVRTNEERIQNIPEFFTSEIRPYNSRCPSVKGRLFYQAEKIDGSSSTFYLKDNEFGVCSHNIDLKETEGNVFWKIAREYKMEEKLRSIGRDIAIQGEIAGPGIQKNRLGLPKLSLFIFTVVEIKTGFRLNFKELKAFCLEHDLSMVPIINESWEFPYNITMEDIIKMADGQSLLNPKAKREGIVFRALDDNFLSFKTISNQYLLKNEE